MDIQPGPLHLLEPAAWAEALFATVDLGDPRRTRRVVALAGAFASLAGLSLPKTIGRWPALKATYRMLHRKEATPDALQSPSRQCVRTAITAAPTSTAAPSPLFLLVEDTTTLSWPGNEPVRGLGPVGEGTGGLQGFLLHSVLALRWPGTGESTATARRPPVEVLGLLDQQAVLRVPRPAGEKKTQRARRNRPRESQRWLSSTERIGPVPEGVAGRWVRVADREADYFEYLARARALGHDVVVRLCQDRAVEADGIGRGRLKSVARSMAPLGAMDLVLRGRSGEPGRAVRLSVAAMAARILRPQTGGKKKGAGGGEGGEVPAALELTVVRVWEEGGKLEWLLVTSLAAGSLAEVSEVVRMYSARWVIEEFHKTLKSGLGAERLQLEDGGSLFAAVAVMSVVAVRLLALRERGRLLGEEAAEEGGLSETELRVLRVVYRERRGREIRTVRDVVLAIGALGGHLGRKGDGMPGVQTLWLGLRDLLMMVEGYLAATKARTFG